MDQDHKTIGALGTAISEAGRAAAEIAHEIADLTNKNQMLVSLAREVAGRLGIKHHNLSAEATITAIGDLAEKLCQECTSTRDIADACRRALINQLVAAEDSGAEVEVTFLGAAEGKHDDPDHHFAVGVPTVDDDGFVQLIRGSKSTWWYPVVGDPSDPKAPPAIVGVRRRYRADDRWAKVERERDEARAMCTRVCEILGGGDHPADVLAQAAMVRVSELRLRAEHADDRWAKVCAELGLIESAELTSVTSRIQMLRRANERANENLAAYCPEVDPSRSGLDSTVATLIDEVLKPALEDQGISRLLRGAVCHELGLNNDAPASAILHAVRYLKNKLDVPHLYAEVKPVAAAAAQLLGLADEPTEPNPAARRTWAELRETGMLWLINRTLHLFGWAIVVVENETGEITGAHPVRTVWRGFPAESDDRGFRRVTKWMVDNAEQLMRECEPDDIGFDV